MGCWNQLLLEQNEWTLVSGCLMDQQHPAVIQSLGQEINEWWCQRDDSWGKISHKCSQAQSWTLGGFQCNLWLAHLHSMMIYTLVVFTITALCWNWCHHLQLIMLISQSHSCERFSARIYIQIACLIRVSSL